jgi:hypothetical protein
MLARKMIPKVRMLLGRNCVGAAGSSRVQGARCKHFVKGLPHPDYNRVSLLQIAYSDLGVLLALLDGEFEAWTLRRCCPRSTYNRLASATVSAEPKPRPDSTFLLVGADAGAMARH